MDRRSSVKHVGGKVKGSRPPPTGRPLRGCGVENRDLRLPPEYLDELLPVRLDDLLQFPGGRRGPVSSIQRIPPRNLRAGLKASPRRAQEVLVDLAVLQEHREVTMRGVIRRVETVLPRASKPDAGYGHESSNALKGASAILPGTRRCGPGARLRGNRQRATPGG